jgi:hypothetical protein
MALMTRARFLTHFVVGSFVFLGPVAATSCGGDSKTTSSTPSGAAGMAGSAGSAAKPGPITCGDNTCNPLALPPPNTAAACCTPDDGCGIDSTPLAAYGVMFADPCQPKNQAGDLDDSCPVSPQIMVPTSNGSLPLDGFKGCCHTDTHTCGYMLDKLGGLFDLGLGCVDSAPFLDGGTPSACGAGN